MPTPKHHHGLKGDECQCGRRLSLRHCITCGSSRVYARQNRRHEFLNGTTKLVEIEFRCQSCGHLFIEEEREFCEAPPIGQVLAALRLKAIAEAQETGEHLRPADVKIAEAIKTLQEQPEDDNNKANVAATRTVITRELRLEWARKKLAGRAPTKTVDEYVKRRLAGEIFE